MTQGPASDPPTTTPPTPVLHVRITAITSMTVNPGKSVVASVLVYATETDSKSTVLKLATTKKTTIAPTCSSSGCNLGTQGADGIATRVTVAIPSGTATGGITLTATASATGATTVKKTLSINVKKATSSGTSNDSNTTDSGTTSGSGTTNTTTTTIPGSGAAYVPPSAAGALAPANNGAPSAQFPQIAPQTNGANPNSALAAGATQNMGALKAASPEPQELTFQRLASTQAAWLAALLVAFSLLLTQVRLNKPANARRRKGTHRRQRSGAFQA